MKYVTQLQNLMEKILEIITENNAGHWMTNNRVITNTSF